MSTTGARAGHAFELEVEEWNRAKQVAEGVWIIATKHRPGYSAHNPEINNRCFVFRLKDASAGNKDVLVVANTPDPVAMAEVRRLEKETGLQVAYIVGVGGGHCVMLPTWHNEFTSAKVLVGPTRIPRMRQGKELASSPRFVSMNQDDPLPMFKGQLEAVNFDGLLGFRENRTPKEGGKDSMFGMLKFMLTEMPPKDPTDELWLFHVASGTVIGGENLGWILSEAQYKRLPWMMRMMMKPNQLFVMTGPRKVSDKSRVSQHWKKILGWPSQAVLTYHDTLGFGFKGDGRSALQAAVASAKQV